MTKAEFLALPLLLLEHQVVAATGYSRKTVQKMADCGVLELVKPDGCGWGRFRKVQVARLAGVSEEEVLAQWHALTAKRPMLLAREEVQQLTGLSEASLPQLLTPLRPAGTMNMRYRVEEIAAVCGITQALKVVKGTGNRSKERRIDGGALTGAGDRQ